MHFINRSGMGLTVRVSSSVSHPFSSNQTRPDERAEKRWDKEKEARREKEEKDEDDIEKILSFELSRRYPLLDNSSSCTTYVSVQEVLNDLTTPRKDHQTRKSISTSSGFPKENVCETLYKVDAREKSKVRNQESRLGISFNRFSFI
ncbi:hypothetical protein M0802_004145 [Mischocyttarus mexicanus]|nr:hypothetical protein M0802_004145 [Mischocyttarus mexicanus]